MKGEI